MLDLLTELIRRADLRVEEPRVHTFAGPWAVELPPGPLLLFILRGSCTFWPEGERHSRGLSKGHLLLASGAIRCVLQQLGPRLDAVGRFDAQTGDSLHEPFFPPSSEGPVQLLAAPVRWNLRPSEVLTPPHWVVIGAGGLSLSHARGSLHEALAEELLLPGLGRTAVIQRLLEAMLIRALRRELLSGFWSVSGWLGALSDPVLRTAFGDVPDVSCLDSVRALAGHSHRSIRRLSARVKSISGLRPRKLLSRLRLADALDALERPAPDLLAIARASGFGTVSSFCRAFSREIGCSPAAYWRRRHRRRFPRVAR